jgi:hypothetical protein
VETAGAADARCILRLRSGINATLNKGLSKVDPYAGVRFDRRIIMLNLITISIHPILLAFIVYIVWICKR